MSDHDSLLALFEAERLERPPARSAEHGLTDLRTSLEAGVPSLPVADGVLRFGPSLAVKWVASTLVAAAVVGTAWTLVPDEPKAEPPPPPPRVTAPATLPLPAPDPPLPAPAPPEPEPPKAPEPPRAVASTERDSTFAEELRLIRLAKQEHDGGRHHLAEVWLDEHSRRFPSGVFASEREALRVLVGCRNASQSSRERARAFVKANPRSPLLDRISRACDLGTERAPLPLGSAQFPDVEKDK